MERNERLKAADKCASRYTDEKEKRIARAAFMDGCEFEAQGEAIKGVNLSTLESEKPMNQEELEKEIERYCGARDSRPVPDLIEQVARHFAKWGAEHFRDSTKMMKTPNDLEEASEEYRQGEVDTGSDYIDDSDGDSLYRSACLADAFKAGAKWQAKQDQETIELAEDHAYLAGAVNEREKMMKEAVEGVLIDNVDGTQEICLHGNRYGDKVRIIVIPKEDEK